MNKIFSTHKFTFLRPFIVILLFSNAFLFSAKAQTIWYVTSSGAGTQSGASWANASKDLQSVLNSAVSGDEVQVGAGEYSARRRPSTNEVDTTSGNASFYIVNKNITLLGGYPALGGTTRDAALNKTVLTGKRHVLLTINLSNAAIFDGFEVSGGNSSQYDSLIVANIAILASCGGGMYNHASSPTILNCVFANNHAYAYGGGVFNNGGSSPTFTNCVFSENAGEGGGGYNSDDNANITFNNCVFNTNESNEKNGGGWYNNSATGQLTFNNCTFFENFAGLGVGGGLYNIGTVTINNTIFYNNQYVDLNTFDFITTGYNSDITNIGGTLTIRNSMLQSDYPCTACVSKNNKNPIFKNIFNPRGVDGKFRTSDDGLTFNCGSPAINKGNNAFVVGSIDLIGQPRMTDVVDLGAYESDLNTPQITTQPARQDVCEGTPASFSVVVAGTRPVTYQWQSRYYSGTFANITGATSATYTIPVAARANTYYYYRCLVTGNCSVYSDSAFFTVNTPPFIVSQPSNVSACPGGNVYFKAFAQNYDGVAWRVTYQWQINTGAGFTNITGATDTLLAVNAVSLAMNNYQYRYMAFTTCGSVASAAATLKVATLPVAYVDASASGANNGSSWANAFTSLQSAVELLGCVDTIKVAKGDYKPTKDMFASTTPADARDKTFFISKNVVLLGGYPRGGGVRNAVLNPTILRGDIGASSSSSTYHVLVTKDLTNATTIDGFTIKNGYCYVQSGVTETVSVGGVTAYRTRGAGVYNLPASSPNFKACKIVGNSGAEGVGMSNENANITLEYCTFEGNDGNTGSSGILNNNTQLTLKYCVFDANSAFYSSAIANTGTASLVAYSSVFSRNLGSNTKGGVILNQGTATVSLSNCTVYKNRTPIYNEGGALTINNTIFYDNYFNNPSGNPVKTGIGSDITPNGSPLSITNSMLQHNHVCTACVSTNNLNPLFVNGSNPNLINDLDGADNLWFTADDNLQLACGGPALNTGENSLVVGTKDAIGNQRIQLSTVDLGAYESALNAPIITTHPLSTTLCTDENLALSVAATGSGTLQYQWQSNTNTVFENINGATNPTFSITNIGTEWNNGRFRCVISNGVCSIPSDSAKITVNTAPNIYRQPEQISICPMGKAVFSVGSQALGAQTFQWQVNTGTGFENMAGKTDSILTLLNASPTLNGNQYRCVVNSLCAPKISLAVRLYFPQTPELYVDYTARGIGDGSSWTNAFTTLQAATDLVQCGTVTKIHVAQGTYYPLNHKMVSTNIWYGNPNLSTDRDNNFFLSQNVQLLGGYPSGGGVRNPKNYPTTLSADIGNQYVTTDNTNHIIITEDLDNTTVIDGFTFTGTSGGTYSGAILNYLSAPIISNCVFSGNDLGMLNTEANPTVSDCRFEGGSTGMLNEEMSGVLLNRCVFSKNFQAIRNYNFVDLEANGCVFDANEAYNTIALGIDNEEGSNTVLNNCVFSNNRSVSTDAVILANNYYPSSTFPSSYIINSCTFYKNESYGNSAGAHMISSAGGVLRIRNSIFYNNSYMSGGNKVYVGNNVDIDAFGMQDGKFTIENAMLQSQQVCPTCPSFNNRYPQFADTVNLIGQDAKWGTNDDGLRLACTATASNIGNNTYATTTDIIGNPRIQFSTIDLGAYEGTALGAVVRTHPQNARICLGTTATFFVEAVNGAGVTYQWQEDAGTGYRNMTGATQATLSIPSVSVDKIASKFRCLLITGCATASEPAVIVMDTLPNFTLQPQTQVTCLSSDAQFSAAATSTRPVTYQWQFNSGTSFVSINGATNATLNLTNLDANARGLYRCMASNGCAARPSVEVVLNIPTDSVLYVDESATGLNNGKTWANAFTSLQSAIDRAKCAVVKSIYVAEGYYSTEKPPFEGVYERTGVEHHEVFYLNRDVRLFGGYPKGGGTRNLKDNRTILGSAGRIFIIRNASANMVVDGFEIRQGSTNSLTTFFFSDYTLSARVGGGVACINATPTFRNCRFKENFGGALYSALKSPTLIENCVFEDNQTGFYGYGGGALCLKNGTTTVRGCIFVKNVANYGGAIWCDSAQTLTLSSCLFYENTASGDSRDNEAGASLWLGNVGGTKATINNCTFTRNYLHNYDNNGIAIYNKSAFPLPITNTIFYNNSISASLLRPLGQGRDILDVSHTATFANCMLQDTTLACTNCISKNNTDPRFENASYYYPQGPDEVWGTADDGFQLFCSSPALNAGNDAFVNTSTDAVGKPRIAVGRTDLGAYEQQKDCINYVRLQLKLFLQGPYETATGLMHDSLRVRGFLPQQELYTNLGFTHKGASGGETMHTGVSFNYGNNAIVDWVFLELRDALDSTRVVATRAALLQRDGDVVGTNGSSAEIEFSPVPNGNYYVVVRHRNHLGCRTKLPIPLSKNYGTSLNLTNGTTLLAGQNPLKSIGGVFALYGGDVNRNGQVSYNGLNSDRVVILKSVGLLTPNNVFYGYHSEDATMDGTVRYNGAASDRVLILSVVGLATPNNVIFQQY